MRSRLAVLLSVITSACGANSPPSAPSLAPGAPKQDSASCGTGLHDGGDGSCVPGGSCASGFSLDGFGSCAGWFDAGSMVQGRAGHTATLLSDCRVLVTGGWALGPIDGCTPTADDPDRCAWELSSAELYDPAQNRWLPAAPLPHGRTQHTATRLADGRVLVAGGRYISEHEPPGPLYPEPVIYDPGSNTWTATAQLASPRWSHVAALMPDGSVLVADAGITRTERYDVATGKWGEVAPMQNPRGGTVATLLGDGSLLVVEGGGTEQYIPSSNEWRMGGPLPMPRDDYAAVRLLDGRVLVASGYYVYPMGVTSTAALIDPSTGAGQATGSPKAPRTGGSLSLLANGRALLVGGVSGPNPSDQSLASAEIFDPTRGEWAAAPPMRTPHAGTATVLCDGSVLIVGGTNSLLAEWYRTGK